MTLNANFCSQIPGNFTGYLQPASTAAPELLLISRRSSLEAQEASSVVVVALLISDFFTLRIFGLFSKVVYSVFPLHLVVELE